MRIWFWAAQASLVAVALVIFTAGVDRFAPDWSWPVLPLSALVALSTLLISSFVWKRVSRAIVSIRDEELALKEKEVSALIDDHRSEVGLRDHILGSMTEGVILADDTGDVIYANSSAAKFFGRDLLSSVPTQLSQPNGEVVIHHPERRSIEYASIPMEEGRRLFVVQDVTEARRVESIRRDFVSNASHELKTPVAGILATAETLRDAAKNDVEKVHAFSDTLVNEAQRLSQLVQDLLDLARFERGTGPIGAVAFGALVVKEVKVIEKRAAAKGLSVRHDIDENLMVAGVPNDLTLMVRNLLENAVGYTQSGSVHVTLHTEDGHGVLEVTDSGVGIPAADLARIFERFYRVDKARSRDTGGTGLGLSIVRHIAETHGGKVSVESELGVGSTFRVTLPCLDPSRNHDSPSAGSHESTPPSLP